MKQKIFLPLNGRLTRRRVLAGASASIVFAHTSALAQMRSWRIASVCDLSGFAKVPASEAIKGANAYFSALNRKGGIQGRKLELVTADDQFKPELARANAVQFQNDESVIALLSPLGTETTLAIMDAVQDMAIVGPVTGAAIARKKSRSNVFWVRASFEDEIFKLVNQSVTLGYTRVALVHSLDPLGSSVLAAFKVAMEKAKLTPTIIAATPSTTSQDVEPAARAIVSASPQIVLVALAGTFPKFVNTLRSAGGKSSVYGMSLSASPENIKLMGPNARGIGYSLITPSPFASKANVVREYTRDMALGGNSELTYPSLEGYINARVLAEGLRRAGPGATRDSLNTALGGMIDFDVGGMRITYGEGNRLGGNFVDVGVVNSAGRILT